MSIAYIPLKRNHTRVGSLLPQDAAKMASTTLPALILLVDDFNDAREMYAEYLAFRGYRVVTAASGAEALEIAHLPERPTLILMDLGMLGMDGTAVMRSLRSEAAFAQVPIIAFTAHAMKDEHDAAMRNGFDAVIAKPCLPDELITLIDPFLARQQDART
jgi:two-component system cell cycle response regulator DivK